MSADVDIVIPTIPGREESLGRCIDSYEALTPHDYVLNFIVVNDSTTCGEGWADGMELGSSGAPYVHFTNDDIELHSGLWLDACIAATSADRSLPCPVVFNPDMSIQSAGGAMGQADNLSRERKPDRSPVDFTTLPFMTRKQWERIGMIPVHYCSDVWVSYRGRQLGHPTILVEDYAVIHHNHSVGRGAGMSQGERDAMDNVTMRYELAKYV